MNVLIIGQFYLQKDEKYLIDICRGKVSAAHHKWIENISVGLRNIPNVNITLLTTLPVGNFPILNKKLFFKTKFLSETHIEVGFINLPFLKHSLRKRAFRKQVGRWLRSRDGDDNAILIYDLYLPFLEALVQNDKKIFNCTIIPIIPDLPGELCIEYDYYNAITQYYKNKQANLIRKCLKAVDGVIVLTKYMPQALGIPNKKRLVVEGIIDSPRQNFCEDFHKTTSNIHVLYAGELSKNVGISILLDAFKKIEVPNIVLDICGKGPYENEIIENVKQQTNIVYHGYLSRNDLEELESIVNIYINPRMNNGQFTRFSFPSKNLEYLKTGKPVIAYKLDGIPDEYDEYFIYPQNESVEELVKTILDVAGWDTQRLIEHGLKQLKFIEQKNSRKQSERVYNFMKELVK